MKIAAKPAYLNRSKNPYNSLLYDHLSHLGAWVDELTIKRCFMQQYHIIHIHWPDYAFSFPQLPKALSRVFGLLVTIQIAKLKGAKLVWTAHNLQSHEGLHPALEAWFWKRFFTLMDGYISLSNLGRSNLLKRFPQLEKKPYAITPHGHFRNVYPDETDKAAARQSLSIPLDRKVVACTGSIRPYKNIPHLINVFRQINDPNLMLLIAGLPNSKQTEAKISAAAEGDSRIQIRFELIPETQFQYYLRAADLVVLPYLRILNSGSALLSLSFECPTLLPATGTMPELQEQVGEDWIKLYQDELTSQDLQDAIAWATSPRFQLIDLSDFDWDNIAKETLKFYATLAGGSL